MSKKIAIFIYSLGAGGAEKVVSTLLKSLHDKFDITLVLMNETISYEIPKEIEIYYLERSLVYENGFLKLLKLPFLAWKYKRFCRKNGIEVSVSFMNRPNYINIISRLFGNNSKIVINERAMPSLQYGYKNLQSQINRFLIKKLYPKADSIVTNSLGNRNDLKNNFGIKNEIYTLYNPCDVQQIEKYKEENVDFDFSRFTFITIGRLDRGKNHKMIFNTFSMLDDKDSQLLIIGEGELRSELVLLAEKLKIDDRTFFLGHQANPYKWLAKADMFLFSSNHEGFPNVLLEALSCGVPIISTDCSSGPREILAPQSDQSYYVEDKIEFAKYGVLVPLNNNEMMAEAINVLRKDDRLSKQYHYNGIIRAKDFEMERFLKRNVDIWIN